MRTKIRTPRRRLAGAVALAAALLAGAGISVPAHAMAAQAGATASTGIYAPLDRPGPPLSVPLAKLRASLYCQPSVRHAKAEPVLLNPATGVTVSQNFSWNWEPALTKLGIPWCAYNAPQHTLGNIEVSGEYLVYAIRTVHALAGRQIAVMGHSQGGMSMRWALRFWPDTRGMVADVIGFSGSNHGTTLLSTEDCALEGCEPASFQQASDSNFVAALNSGAETFPGISYTEIWTHTDEVVEPNGSAATASAAVHGGGGRITNVPVQQICPLDVDEHLAVGTIDPVAYDLAVDALTHTGPADPARVPSSVCDERLMPGVNPLTAETELQILAGAPGLLSVASPVSLAGVPTVHREPPLACYVYAHPRPGCAKD
jgi:pimeloyl-ACP methyl ester carboxylesterase